jgi:hypothetical protein
MPACWYTNRQGGVAETRTFSVDPQVFGRSRVFHIVVAWTEGIDNRGAHPSVGQAWAAVWEMAEALATAWPNPQSHPRVLA